MTRPIALVASLGATLLFLAACGSDKAPEFPQENETINASEQQTGERLFVETRFEEYFAAHITGVDEPLARGGALRNAPVEFQGMSLGDGDVAAVAAFLASLTEDYDDA
jgi:hypothetical protein